MSLFLAKPREFSAGQEGQMKSEVWQVRELFTLAAVGTGLGAARDALLYCLLPTLSSEPNRFLGSVFPFAWCLQRLNTILPCITFSRENIITFCFEGVWVLLGPTTAVPCSPSNTLQFSSPLHNPIPNTNNRNPPVYAGEAIWVVIFHHCLGEAGQGSCRALFVWLCSAEIW